MSLLTAEVRNYIHTRDWPKGLTYEVRDVFVGDPHLEIIFFRDNFLTLNYDDLKRVTEIVNEIMAKLWGAGIPTQVGKIESVYDEA